MLTNNRVRMMGDLNTDLLITTTSTTQKIHSSHCHFPYIVVVSDPSQVLLQLPVTEISHHVLITLPLPIHRGGNFQSLKSHIMSSSHCHFPYIVVVSDPSQVLLQLPVTEISTPTHPLQSLKSHIMSSSHCHFPYIVVVSDPSQVLLQLPVTETHIIDPSQVLLQLPVTEIIMPSHCHFPYIVVVSDPSQVLLQLPVTEISHHVLITLPLPIHRGGSDPSQSLKSHIMSSSHCHFPYIVVVSDPSQVLLQLPVTEISHHVLITLPLPIHRGGNFQSLKSHIMSSSHCHFPYIVVVSDPSQVLLQLPVTETSHHVLITLPLPIHRGGKSSSSFQSLKSHIMSSSHCHFPYIVVVSDPSQVLLQLPVTEISHHVLITLPLPIHRGGNFQSLKPHIMSSSHCHFPYIVVVSDPSQVLLQLPVTETSHHVLITLPLPIHRGGNFQSLKSHIMSSSHCHFPYIVVVSDPSQVLLQLPVTEISHHPSRAITGQNSVPPSIVKAGREQHPIMKGENYELAVFIVPLPPPSDGHPRRSLIGPAVSNLRTIALSDLT
ncbi:hypothetical protein J6590_097116 [Homalodisca vitripennis]|nr:hypothetical protein J6590_097116 [Homalodisca vitripennis]